MGSAGAGSRRDHGRSRRPPRGAAAGDRGGDPRPARPRVADRGRPGPRPPARGALPGERGRRCSSARSPRRTSPTSSTTSARSATTTAPASSARSTASARSGTGAARSSGLTCRIGRAVYGTIEIIADFVETGKSILIMGRPGHRQDHDAARGRPRARRRAAQARGGGRHLQRDRGRRRHPAPGDRQGAPDAGPDASRSSTR